MIVICINNESHMNIDITIGRKYQVYKETALFYKIIDDKGLYRFTFKSNFVNREQKLKRILNV